MLRTVICAGASVLLRKAVKGKNEASHIDKARHASGRVVRGNNEQCEAPTMHDVLDPSGAAHIKFQKFQLLRLRSTGTPKWSTPKQTLRERGTAKK